MTVSIKRIVLDSLKPRETSIIELSQALCSVDGADEVDVTVTEVDVKTETIKLVIRGKNVNYESLSKIMDTLLFLSEGKIFLIPVILSLVPASSKFCNGVPIVPILQLQNFLNELPANIHLLNLIEVKL